MLEVPTHVHQQQTGGNLYSEAMERYINHKLQDVEWREHSVRDHRGRLEEFLTIIGDKPIKEITRLDMRNFR